MNIDAYFERINDSGSRAPTVETLRRIHRAHLLAVPFENLSIHMNQQIHLDESWLFDKIVINRRGGFCYEQNGLFAMVLRQLGYDVTLVEARVPTATGEMSIRFDHLALIVALEERWLVDVGFGDSFLEPLRLDVPTPQLQDGKLYRVQHDGAQGIYASRDQTGSWQDQYHFYMQPRHLRDFEAACVYHQTSPQSHFTRKRVCSLPTKTGRITLSGDTLIVTENGHRRETPLRDEDSIAVALLRHFGIVL